MPCWRTKKPHFIIVKQSGERISKYLVLGGQGEGTWYFSCICGKSLLSFKGEGNDYDIEHSLLVMCDYLWWMKWKLWKNPRSPADHHMTIWGKVTISHIEYVALARQHFQIHHLSIRYHDRLAFLLTASSPASIIVFSTLYVGSIN